MTQMNTDFSTRRRGGAEAPAIDGQEGEKFAQQRENGEENREKYEFVFGHPTRGGEDVDEAVNEPNRGRKQQKGGKLCGDRAEPARPVARASNEAGHRDHHVEGQQADAGEDRQVSLVKRGVHEASMSLPGKAAKLKNPTATLSKTMHQAWGQAGGDAGKCELSF